MTTHDYQGTYDVQMPIGYSGMIATANNRDAVSYAIEGQDADFGRALGQGSADRGAVVGGADFLGISIADKSLDRDSYGVGTTASLLRKGVIWVMAATAVSPADPVTYDNTGALGAGLIHPVDGARFEGTATAGELVRVYLG